MKKPNVKNIIAIRNYRRWLLEAKGLNEKSVVKMERAIHLYRDFTEDEDFNRFNADRAINFKNFLKQKKYRGNAMAPNSYRTYLIHLRGFFTWLCTQSGYYSFVEVPEGDYQIMIVEPLGYASDGNPKTTTVVASET
ncbi:MAG: site-specific integrase, partial [Bacteroidetes bacterium]|nr:site-specific integrase [Bacteroidota bacterium]